jgi:hypothetical protein
MPNQRIGGDALEAPMIAPDDLIGSGLGKSLLALGKGAAAMMPVMGGIIKNKGGNWTNDAISMGFNVGQQEAAGPVATNFATTQLTKYITNRLGTQDDELRKLAEQGVSIRPASAAAEAVPLDSPDLLKKRVAEGFPAQGVGQSPLARQWEADVDSYIHPDTKLKDRYDLASEIPIGAKYYDIGAGFASQSLGFDDLVSTMDSALQPGSSLQQMLPKHLQLTPEKVANMSMEKAARWKHAVNQHQQAQAEVGYKKDLELLPTTHEYPEGYRWVELTKPKDMPEEEGSAYLKSLLEREGTDMQNCVGGYCEPVSKGDRRIFSLRDAEGKPHADIELEPVTIPQAVRDEAIDEYLTDFLLQKYDLTPADPMFGQLAGDQSRRIYAAQQLLSEGKVYDMPQVKGKQNRGLMEKYHPFVQDFIRNPPENMRFNYLDEVQHAGLLDGTPFGQQFINKEELLAAKAEFEKTGRATLANGKPRPEYERVLKGLQELTRMQNDLQF